MRALGAFALATATAAGRIPAPEPWTAHDTRVLIAAAVGIAVVVAPIVVLKMHAFLALDNLLEARGADNRRVAGRPVVGHPLAEGHELVRGRRRRDPANELIAATSVVHNVPLATRDRRIRRSKVVPIA